MRKIIFKLNSFLLAIFLIFSNLSNVFASSSGNIVDSYTVNKNLTSLDLSFINDVLRYVKSDKFKKVGALNDLINISQNFEKLNKTKVFNGSYNFLKILDDYDESKGFTSGGGSSGGSGQTRNFYTHEYGSISEFKKLVRDFNIRKSVDEKTLNRLIDKNTILNNEEFNKLFKKWSNKILNYYCINENKDISNNKHYKLYDLDVWYLKEEFEQMDLEKAFKTNQILDKNGYAVMDNFRFNPIIYYFVTPRIVFESDIMGMNHNNLEGLLKDTERNFRVMWSFQTDKNFELTDKFLKKEKNYLSGCNFLMFGSLLNDKDIDLSFRDVNMEPSPNDTYSKLIKYHKFLVKLPDGKFKVAYIVDFDCNRHYDGINRTGYSNFNKYMDYMFENNKDMLHEYFTNSYFYDYDLVNQNQSDLNINDLMTPYNSANINNKDVLSKLNNINDFLYFLMTNLNYNKHFDKLNKRLDKFEGLLLGLEGLRFYLDNIQNHQFFDYEKLNEIIKNNLEEFNNKYIEQLSSDLKYITNLVKENKIEILKNNDKIVDVYNKVIEIDKNIDSINTRFNKFADDLDYIKSNLKSSGQNETDNSFKNQFNEPGKNRISDSLNFFDKFIKFFKEFFVVTETFDFKKIDTSKIYKKIPFSIFYDITSIIKKLIVPPKVPKFDILIYTETIVVDFEKFESLAVIVRSFILLYVVIFLVMKIYSKVG